MRRLLAILTLAAAATTAQTNDATTRADVVYWESIKDTTDPELLNDYLKRFPNGQFTAIAKSRLRNTGPAVVGVPATPAPTPPAPPPSPEPAGDDLTGVSVVYLGGDIPKMFVNHIGIMYVRKDRIGIAHVGNNYTSEEANFVKRAEVTSVKGCRYGGLSKAICFTMNDGRTIKMSAVAYRLKGGLPSLPLPWANNTLIPHAGQIDPDVVKRLDQPNKDPKVLTGCRDYWLVKYDSRLCLLDGKWPGNKIVFEHAGIREAINKAWGTTIE